MKATLHCRDGRVLEFTPILTADASCLCEAEEGLLRLDLCVEFETLVRIYVCCSSGMNGIVNIASSLHAEYVEFEDGGVYVFPPEGEA